MDKVEVANRFFALLGEKKWEEAGAMLDEGFCFHGVAPAGVEKDDWLEFHQSISSAFPDWTYEILSANEEEGEVHLQLKISGTHTEKLSLPLHSIPSIPATGISISLPKERARITFNDKQITALHVERGEEGGLFSILRQLRGSS